MAMLKLLHCEVKLVAVKNQDFEMYSGNTKNIACTIRDADGELKDLTGCNIRWILQKSSTLDGVISKTLIDTVENGIEVVSTGIFNIILSPADTEGLSGKFYHECEIEDGDGNIFTVFIGKVTIIKTHISI